MPDIVEKTFVFEGEKAITVMRFLGLPTGNEGEYALPWQPLTASCVKGVNQSGYVYELCDPTIRANKLKFTRDKEPRLEFTGFWRDAETGSVPKVPRYFFHSPVKDSSEARRSAWHKILGSFKDLDSYEVKKVFSGSSPLLQVVGDKRDGTFSITIGIDPRPLTEREKAMTRYEGCVKKLANRSGGC